MHLVFGYIRSWELSEEILSDERNPRESVQLIIFSFKRILITITDDDWNYWFHKLWTIRHGHFGPAQNHVSTVFQTLGLLKSWTDPILQNNLRALTITFGARRDSYRKVSTVYLLFDGWRFKWTQDVADWIFVINIRLKEKMMSWSDFLEFLTSDRIFKLGTQGSLSREAGASGLRVYSVLGTQWGISVRRKES